MRNSHPECKSRNRILPPIGSESKLQSELQLARRVGRIDDSRARAIGGCARIAPIRMVEGVEEIGLEQQVHAFPRQVEPLAR